MSVQDRSTDSGPLFSRSAAIGMMILAWLFGTTSLMAFFVLFLLLGSPDVINLAIGERAALCLDALLCCVFFVQHSVMARPSYRQWSARFIPFHYHGATYTVASGVALLLLVVLWQESAQTLASAEGVTRWGLRAIYVLVVVGFAWGILALRSFDTFGLRPIVDRLRGTESPNLPFTVRGPYRWVRHPLYTCCLLMIWSHPNLTPDRLLFNVLFTAWIVVGTVLEERDLVAAFGESYRDYQGRVPMLIPCHLRPAG